MANCVTRKKSGRCSEGWEHIVDEHFSGKKGKSQFTIGEEELKILLQSPRVVSKLPKESAGKVVRYLRVVKLAKNIGIDVKNGDKKTKYISVFTDRFGNILTATPGKIR